MKALMLKLCYKILTNTNDILIFSLFKKFFLFVGTCYTNTSFFKINSFKKVHVFDIYIEKWFFY